MKFSIAAALLLCAACASTQPPLYLAAEDPRMNDFANNVLVKLRRAMPRLHVHYPFVVALNRIARRS